MGEGTEVVLSIRGMTCGHCKAAVEQALRALEGVSGAEVDLASGSAVVRCDESHAGRDDFRRAVEEAGYELV